MHEFRMSEKKIIKILLPSMILIAVISTACVMISYREELMREGYLSIIKTLISVVALTSFLCVVIIRNLRSSVSLILAEDYLIFKGMSNKSSIVKYDNIILIRERPRGLIIETKDNQKIPIANTFDGFDEIVLILKEKVSAGSL